MKKIIYFLFAIIVVLLTGCGDSTGGGKTSGDSQSVGKGGSMARFAIKGDYLYTVNKDALRVFDISEPSRPYPNSKVHVPFDVETLYSYKSYLYIGGESGMYIYDANISTQPTQIAKFVHAKSCDPVVVYDDLAFITLNSSSDCRLQNGENTLEIVDIKDPKNPKLLKTMAMWSPKGLGIDQNKTLFICDGTSGLKIFQITKEENNETGEIAVTIEEGAQKVLRDIDCYDVIPHQKNLIVSNGENVKQFDYSHFPMIELGKIK